MGEVRVLVVEDSEVVRRAVCSLLEGFPEVRIVCVATDGLEAVERAACEKPDVVVLDIRLPRLNGIEAACRIRTVTPNSKVLFLSQYDSWAGAQEALHTGASGFVVKADAATDLIAGIHAVCQGKRFLSSSLSAHEGEITRG